MLVLSLALPLFVALYIRLQQRRRRLAASFGSFGLGQAAGRGLSRRRHVPPLLFLLALAILILALARPQTVVSLPRIEGTVILVFDSSGSMAADDLQPTRMEAAKAAAQAFVQRQPRSVQIGVVAFSEGGFAVQTPTNDQEPILASINRLTPERGTSLGQGILVALDTLTSGDAQPDSRLNADQAAMPTPTPTPMPEGTYTSAAIVLLSDGENNMSPDPLAAAQAAADRGVRIYTIGIGSAAGATLHIDGFTIHSQLDEAMLQRIAQITDGVYYNVENEEDLQRIYADLEPQLVIKPEKMEVTSMLAGVSLLVLLIGGSISLRWFGRLP
jgi:Ca-activated chloride channel family protein